MFQERDDNLYEKKQFLSEIFFVLLIVYEL